MYKQWKTLKMQTEYLFDLPSVLLMSKPIHSIHI